MVPVKSSIQMDDEVFAFTHIDFTQNAKNTAEVFWNDTSFTDITLVTFDDKQINAHKIILSSFSPLFRNIIDRNPHQKPIIYLKDITHTHLLLLLKFIYIGSCEVKASDLEAFLATAKDLKIDGIDEGLYQENHYKTNYMSTFGDQIISPIFQNHKDIPKKEDYENDIADFKELEIVKLEHELLNPGQGNEKLPVSEPSLLERKVVNQVSVSCPKCRKQFKYIGILTKHMKEIHFKRSKKNKKPKHKEGSFVCSLCESKFTTETLLTIHTAANHVIRTCRVEWCLKECESRKLETKHFKNKHSRDQGKPRLKEHEAPAPCNKCGKELTTKAGMRKHILTHEALTTIIGAGLVFDRKEGKK